MASAIPPSEPGIGLSSPEAPLSMLEKVREHGLGWDAEKKHWRNAKGVRICGAGPKRAKGPCRALKLYGNGRCHHHGGPTPSGIASATYKHGRWSKVLNPENRKDYLDAKEDKSLMDITRPLAILDAQVAESLQRKEALDTPEFRKRARDLYREARVAIASDPAKAGAALNNLGALLDRGVEEDRARDEVSRRVEQFAKQNTDAWKIRLSAAHAINQNDLTAVLAAFIQVVIQETPKELHGPILRRLDREVLGGRLALPAEY